jgi:hypothetical protein
LPSFYGQYFWWTPSHGSYKSVLYFPRGSVSKMIFFLLLFQSEYFQIPFLVKYKFHYSWHKYQQN